MKKKDIVIEQDPEAPVAQEVLAQAIVDISAAAKKLCKSGLNKKAIVVLVAHSSGRPQYVVGLVLDALEQLAKDYTTKGKP